MLFFFYKLNFYLVISFICFVFLLSEFFMKNWSFKLENLEFKPEIFVVFLFSFTYSGPNHRNQCKQEWVFFIFTNVYVCVSALMCVCVSAVKFLGSSVRWLLKELWRSMRKPGTHILTAEPVSPALGLCVVLQCVCHHVCVWLVLQCVLSWKSVLF